jgi:hypothetical protein
VSGGCAQLISRLLDMRDPEKQVLEEEVLATSGDLLCYCGFAINHPAPGVSALLRLKTQHSALFQNSRRRRIPTNDDKDVYATLRYAAGDSERILVIFNFSTSPISVRVDAGAINGDRYHDLESGRTELPAAGKLELELAGYGHRLLRVDTASQFHPRERPSQ